MENAKSTEGESIEISEASSPEIYEITSTESISSFNPNSILRIEKDIPHLWKGVRECCDRTRIDKEVNARFEEWLTEMKSKHSHLIVMGWGRLQSEVTCRRDDGGVWGRDYCIGKTTMPCFIEFLMPEPQPEIRFNLPYIAIRRSEWYSSSVERNYDPGYVKEGEVVHFYEKPNHKYEICQLKNGKKKLVKAADFKSYQNS